MPRFQQRRNKLRRLLRKTRAAGLLVTSGPNVTYLTGFTGDDSFLLLDRDGQVILSDPRYAQQIEEECPGLDLEIRRPGVKLPDALDRLVRARGLPQLAFEADSLSWGMVDQFRSRMPRIDWVSTRGLVEQLRQVKDREEVAAIRAAVRLAERAFAVVRAALRAEMSEKDVADAIEYQIRRFGGRSSSFTTIVGVGERAARPHYRPGSRRVGESPLLLIDWGALGQLYVSDLTRVLVTGKPSKRLRQIYEIVLRAQRRAIDAIRPGAIPEEVDAAARGVISQAGFGKRFGHSLGHGIGLEVHEQPRLAQKERRPLEPGMVVTVEPGIYLPAWGGIRIEDDVLVTRDGREVLSSVPKEFEECCVQ